MASGVAIPITIQVFKGSTLLKTEKLNQETIKIGKLSSSHLQLEDESVSRMHAVIEVSPTKEVSVVDLGSTNGTFVNGVRVREAFLNSGSTIGLGQSEVQFFASQEKVEIIPSAKNHLGDIIGNRVLDPRSRRGGEQ